MIMHVYIWTFKNGALDGEKFPLPDINWSEVPRVHDSFNVPVGGIVESDPWDKTSKFHPGIVQKISYDYPDPTPSIYVGLL